MMKIIIFECQNCGHQYVPKKNKTEETKLCPWCHSKRVIEKKLE